MDITAYKDCKDCGKNLIIEDFPYGKSYKDKRRPYCKPCFSKRVIKSKKKRMSTVEGWKKNLINNIRQRANKFNIPFNINHEDIKIPEICPIRKTKFVFGLKFHPDSPSVDRRYPNLGYVKGNIFIISNKANIMKNDCTDPNVFRSMADWLEKTRSID